MGRRRRRRRWEESSFGGSAQVGREEAALSYFITQTLPVADNKSVTGRRKLLAELKQAAFVLLRLAEQQ